MRFVLYSTALNGEDELMRLIDRLIDRAGDEAHRLDGPDTDLLRDTKWYKTARPPLLRILKTAESGPVVKRSVDSDGPHAKQFEVRDLESARVAVKLAYTPLKILVEDREADGIFLDILVEELGSPELQALWRNGRTIVPPAFAFINSGGCGAMLQRIEREIDDANQQSCPLRLFAICDSDIRWPGDTEYQNYNTIQKLKRGCAEKTPHVPLHILQKRNIENYIPNTVIEAVRDEPNKTDHTHRYNLFLERNRTQRDHFPLKGGLSQSECIGAINADLYSQEEKPDLLLLEQPLFPKKPRPFLSLNEKYRDKFTAAGLRERDGVGELDRLVSALAKEL